MNVGEHTYVTVSEADTYIASHHRSTSPGRKRWEALQEADKTILLRNACVELEQLPWPGRKAGREQLLSFPRHPAVSVPEGIKQAQIELALWSSDEAKLAEIEQRKGLQEQGVVAFSLGDLSETYGANGATNSAALLCPKAKVLVGRYLSGGYDTC